MPDELNPSASLDEEDLEGILRRLALFEPIHSISRGYGLPERVVQKIADDRASQVRALRRGWKEWISAAEPLCNKTNQVLFLGLCARRAMADSAYRDAIHAVKDLQEVLEREEKSNPDDLAILARIQLGEYDHEKLASELEVTELLDIPAGGPFTRGTYFAREEGVETIEKAVEPLPAPELEDDPEYESVQRRRRGPRRRKK